MFQQKGEIIKTYHKKRIGEYKLFLIFFEDKSEGQSDRDREVDGRETERQTMTEKTEILRSINVTYHN